MSPLIRTWARTSALTVTLLCGIAITGCGDPVVVVGDQPGTMRAVAGEVPGIDPGNATPATREPLNGPSGAAGAPDGMLYILDTRNSRVIEVSPTGEVREVVPRGGVGRPNHAVFRGGFLFLADPNADRIFRVDVASGLVETLAGTDDGPEPATGLQALEVTLSDPAGIAVADDGAIYFSEQSAHRVWRIEPGGSLTPVAGTGTQGNGGTGPATEERLRVPSGLTLHGDELYIADTGNNRVRRVDLTSGQMVVIAGSSSGGYEGDGGLASAAALRFPEAVQVSPDGNTLYIADRGNHVVRSVNLASQVIETFAGTGTAEFTGTGLEAGQTGLDSPSGLTLLQDRFLIVVDTGNRLIWRSLIRF